MGPEVVFRLHPIFLFATILDDEQDLAFASTMVQVRTQGQGTAAMGRYRKAHKASAGTQD
jgi:hypothetical protein